MRPAAAQREKGAAAAARMRARHAAISGNVSGAARVTSDWGALAGLAEMDGTAGAAWDTMLCGIPCRAGYRGATVQPARVLKALRS